MAMKFLVNITSTDDSYTAHPEYFLELAAGDYFIFSAGSADVADGQPIPTAAELTAALTVLPLSGTEEISKIFVADISAGIIREIPLSGQQNKRYVFCVSFYAATIDEPVLELWDTISYDTTLLQMLGAGTPANSNIRGIVTTSGLPDGGWTGKALAGALNANRLLLNDGTGALTVAKDLYFNMYGQVRSTLVTAFENVKFLIQYYQAI